MGAIGSFLKSAAKVTGKAGLMLGKAALQNMFPTTYANVGKLRSAYNKLTDNKPPETEKEAYEAFNQSVLQTNDLLSQSIDIQKQQNVILQNLIHVIGNLKEGGINGGNLLNNLIDFPSIKNPFKNLFKRNKGLNFKGNGVLQAAELEAKNASKVSRVLSTVGKGAVKVGGGLLKGVAGIVGGLALDFAADKLKESGHEKLGAVADIGSSALTGAGIGATIGSVVPGIGTAIGGAVGGLLGTAVGLFQNVGTLFGSSKTEDKVTGDLFKTQKDGTKLLSSPIIEFKASDVKFTAKDMVIRADNIQINGVASQTMGSSGVDVGNISSPPPNDQSLNNPQQLGIDLVDIRTSTGKTTKVNAAFAANFQGFINDMEATGYKINSLGGYANRANVNNPSVKSYHAFGAAIDINPASNPNRSTKTDLPQQTGAIAAAHGLGWGMNWHSVKDPMHFSIAKAEQGSVAISRTGIMAGEVSGNNGGGGSQPDKEKRQQVAMNAPAGNMPAPPAPNKSEPQAARQETKPEAKSTAPPPVAAPVQQAPAKPAPPAPPAITPKYRSSKAPAATSAPSAPNAPTPPQGSTDKQNSHSAPKQTAMLGAPSNQLLGAYLHTAA
jgi:D-alanyl-D-alanine carboxypeptidase